MINVTGNSIVKFNLTGDKIGEYPGWYNFPHDIIIGGDNQVTINQIKSVLAVKGALKMHMSVSQSFCQWVA